ncbi:MAG: hypothetical protein WCP65_05990, partial [Bacteroidota bacterium]
TMGSRTLLILNNYNKIWSGKIKTADKITKISDLLTIITDLAKAQGLNTSGATDTKNNNRVAASTQALHVEHILKSYYDDTDDATNLAKIDFNYTTFAYGDIDTSIKNMSLIYDTAAAILIATPTAFAGYNLETTDMADLKLAIEDLKNSVPVQTTMKSGNKAITKELKSNFKLLRKEMTKLDSNINTYAKKNPEFVNVYTNGRRIVQVGIGHKTAEVALMPEHFEAVLGKEYTLGDVLTIRNHSAFSVQYGFTNTPEILPIILKSLEGGGEIRVTVERDDSGSFGHWLILNNQHDLDDVNVTVLLAKG